MNANSKITSTVADGTRKLSQDFIDKFGFGALTIDKFDTFIIDTKMAADPGTSDQNSCEHKNFVTERAAAKRKLNAAAPYLNGNSFQVIVAKAGIEYTVVPWVSNSKDIASAMGNRVRTFTDGRFSELRKLHNKAEALLDTIPADHDYHMELKEGVKMLGMMRTQAIELQSRVKGLVVQYNTAADAVEEHVRQLTADFESAGALSHDKD